MLNISGIAPSKFVAGRVYLTVDGHFNDDYHPYVFVSEDYGHTWKPIVEGLPQTSVHRIREHPGHANFLVAGTEEGAFATFDGGAHWVSLDTNLPPVPVYDLVFQERDQALVLGTHGRSIWVLDHIEALAELTPHAAARARLFSIPPAHHENIFGGQFWFGHGEYFAPNPPSGAVLTYYLPRATAAVTITVADSSGKVIRTIRGPSGAGMNRACWDLRQAPALTSGPYPSNCGGSGGGGGGRGGGSAGALVLPGRYTVAVTPQGGGTLTRDVMVEEDPRFQITQTDRTAHHAAVMSAYTLQEQLGAARDAAQALSIQMTPIRQYLTSAGEASKSPLETLEKAAPEITRLQQGRNRAIAAGNGAWHAWVRPSMLIRDCQPKRKRGNWIGRGKTPRRRSRN